MWMVPLTYTTVNFVYNEPQGTAGWLRFVTAEVCYNREGHKYLQKCALTMNVKTTLINVNTKCFEY